MKIQYKQAKTLIRHSGVSVFSWSEIYLNPYQGCYHNCVYCDGKSEHYHMHEQFGDLIYVKENAPQLFEKFLKNKGFQSVHSNKQSAIDQFFPTLKAIPESKNLPKSIITIGGGVCDVYQQPEKVVKMTRRLLEIVYDYQFPLWILTKNDLVLRDIDLIKKINEETYACVNFTITLNDERAQKIFEPRASTTSERFEAIRTLRKEGIHCGVFCYPCLPFIGDTEENIGSIYQRAKEVGVEFIYCCGLTLKPGRNKEDFMQTLLLNYPEIYPKYEILYGNNNKYGIYDFNEFKKLNLLRPLHTGYKYGYELGLDYTAKRYIPKGRITSNLQISELLRRIIYLQSEIIYLPRYEIIPFSNAARLVEDSKRDFGTFSDEDFASIPTPNHVQEIIKEFVQTGESSFLKDLERKAYDIIVERNY
ncbi:MAG TPA: radical SAM protein [Candidatus Bathyarchaeia archaeon]|nr:radical SAM protein [Candidatus Bathyarchaeia archaeon]